MHQVRRVFSVGVPLEKYFLNRWFDFETTIVPKGTGHSSFWNNCSLNLEIFFIVHLVIILPFIVRLLNHIPFILVKLFECGI